VVRKLVAAWCGVAVAIHLPARPPDAAHSSVTYRIESQSSDGRLLSQFSPVQIEILEKLNRADRDHLRHLPELVVPNDWVGNELAYSPMPASYDELGTFAKGLIVYLRAQVFGAYESGALVRWGPVNSGAEHSPTPPGLYHLNWKSPGHRSTVNPEWFMPWYFNFGNQQGLSFHEYAMPGTPVSHGCVRLLRRDAQWLYEWGEEWTLDVTRTLVRQPGTPVVVIGAYDFAAQPPWRSLPWLGEPIRLPSLSGLTLRTETARDLCS
jgi:hypothetical protein